MNAFDISFLFFFVTILVKICVDTYEYWYGEEGVLSATSSAIKPAVAPKHIPAPMRPSPSAPNFRSTPTSYNVRPMPTTTARPAARVARPIKKQPTKIASRVA